MATPTRQEDESNGAAEWICVDADGNGICDNSEDAAYDKLFEDKADKWERPVDVIDEDKAEDGIENEDNQADVGEVADESLTCTGQTAGAAV